MKITTLRTDCPAGRSCPSIHRIDTDPENFYMILKRVSDPAVNAAFAHLVGDGEFLGCGPNTLLPEV